MARRQGDENSDFSIGGGQADGGRSDPLARFREQAKSVFEYLAELVRLRTALVRDIDKYEKVFWFDNLPNDPACYTIAWATSEEHGDDVWLEIRKQPEPSCPTPPAVCQDWLDAKDLRDSSREPELRPHIVVTGPRPADTENLPEAFNREPEYKYLKDQPAVESAWRPYVAKKWKPWAEEHRKWAAVQESYAALFAIHQSIQRLGEEYELVLGLGYLTWKSAGDAPIKRHVLVANASLEFDAVHGLFTVRAAAEGAKLRLETDMLLPSERPPVEQQRTIDVSLQAASESPWDKSTTVAAMKGWVQSIDNRGEFVDQLAPHPSVDPAPRISWAPAIVLRRRTGQTVLGAIEKIIKSIQEGGIIRMALPCREEQLRA